MNENFYLYKSERIQKIAYKSENSTKNFKKKILMGPVVTQ